MALDITSLTTEKVHLKTAPTDKDSKAREVKDLVFEVASGDATIATDTDGKGAFAVSSDVAGVSVITVRAKPDLTGVDPTEIADTVNYTTTAPLATALNVTADAAVQK